MHAYNYKHAHTCVHIFSFLKTLKLTLVHTNSHILLAYTTHMIPHTHKHTCTHTSTHSYTHTHTLRTHSRVCMYELE